jgi:hypothetical protein
MGLFTVACAERVKSFMCQTILLQGLELAEQLAEGVVDESERNRFLTEFRALTPGQPGPQAAARVVPYYAVHAMFSLRTGQSAEKRAVTIAEACAGVYYAADDIPRALYETEVQAELLRDIVGNPFRPVIFSPEWRTSTVIALARQMYDSRDFSAMPILADALQDAGCDNEDILQHCRDANATHVRGCWVVDLVLGQE